MLPLRQSLASVIRGPGEAEKAAILYKPQRRLDLYLCRAVGAVERRYAVIHDPDRGSSYGGGIRMIACRCFLGLSGSSGDLDGPGDEN